jgi:hypothetical protein
MRPELTAGHGRSTLVGIEDARHLMADSKHALAPLSGSATSHSTRVAAP